MTRARDLADGADKDITGTLTTDGLTVAGNVSVDSGTIKLDGNYPTGTQNVALGDQALDALTTGANNTGIGHIALSANTEGVRNVALGGFSLNTNTTGNDNVGIGTGSARGALHSNTTGSNNVAVGANALGNNTTASNNTAVGLSTLYENTTGTGNSALGYSALYSNTTGSNNVSVGTNALDNNTTADSNTAVGHQSLGANTTGALNTAVGATSMDACTTASYNAAFGYGALGSVTTGNDNSALGVDAGTNITTATSNTCIGRAAGDSITTGGNNTIIGASCDAAADAYNAISLGQGIGGVSDYFYFGKSGNVVYNNFTANSNWARASDERWKKEITTNTELGLDFINDLRTVTYKWKAPSELDNTLSEYDAKKTTPYYQNKMYGFIAQEVKQALDDKGITDFAGWNIDATSSDDKQGVSYEMFVIPLVKAVQELKTELDAAKARIATLEAE